MKIDKLKTEAVKTTKHEKVERLNDESLKSVAGGVYCTACEKYFAG